MNRNLLAFVIAMASGGLASQLLPLEMFPKAIAVGLIAATVCGLVTAMTRPRQSGHEPRP